MARNTQLCHNCVTELYPADSVLQAYISEFKADLFVFKRTKAFKPAGETHEREMVSDHGT